MKQKQNTLYFCGDTHGTTNDTLKLTFFFMYQNIVTTKDDFMIQLGDFGWIWHGLNNEKERATLEWIASQNITFCVVLGNHENYNLIEELPIIEKFGGKVRILKLSTGEIYFFQRGEVYEIAGKKVFSFGGAFSIDIEDRVLGKSYWEQELPLQHEYDNALANLEKHDYDVDFVISHTCPRSIMLHMFNLNRIDGKTDDPVANFFDHIYYDKKLKFKDWHFGHFHRDQTHRTSKGSVFKCYYNKIGKVILEDKL